MVIKKIVLGTIVSMAALFSIKSYAYYDVPPPHVRVRIEQHGYPHYYEAYRYPPRVIRHWAPLRRHRHHHYVWVPVPWFGR